MIKRVSIVMAKWCPHCVPPGRDAAKKMARQLGVPLRILNIDYERQAAIADRLIRKYGDGPQDYLIPQIFLEYSDKKIQHVFTGFSESPRVTKTKLNNIFRSPWYKEQLSSQKKNGVAKTN